MPARTRFQKSSSLNRREHATLRGRNAPPSFLNRRDIASLCGRSASRVSESSRNFPQVNTNNLSKMTTLVQKGRLLTFSPQVDSPVDILPKFHVPESTRKHNSLRTECTPLVPESSLPFASRLPAAHRDKNREWNVSKQKWNLC